jgi:hypothetical protein
LASRFIPDSILSAYSAIVNLNNNFTVLSTLLDRVLLRDGTEPNSMSRNLDMNGNAINNVASPANSFDAVRLIDLQTAMPALGGSSLASLASTTGAAMVGTTGGVTVQSQLNTINAQLASYSSNFTTAIKLTGAFSLNNLGGTTPANGIFFGVGGNSLTFATRISNPAGGADSDNQRASALIAATTSDDGNSEEQTLCLLTTIQTGYSTAWAISTAYTLNQNVKANGNIYRCIVAGTSSGAGSGPSTKAASIVDGTVTWQWINDASVNAKVGLYNEVDVKPGAGHSWAQANNLQIESGVLTDFIVNTEFDLTNNSGSDSTAGGKNRYGLYVVAQGANKSTSGVEVTTTNVSTAALMWGLHFSGSKLSSNSVIGIDANSAVGLGIGNGGGAGGAVAVTFTTASIVDSATAPKGISLAGTYSVAALEVTGSAPAAVSIAGTKTIAGIIEQSTTPSGLLLNGTYTTSQITGTGWQVTPAGNLVITPAVSATPANNGQMTFQLTNNTTLVIKVKGSDGVVRSTTLTLA